MDRCFMSINQKTWCGIYCKGDNVPQIDSYLNFITSKFLQIHFIAMHEYYVEIQNCK